MVGLYGGKQMTLEEIQNIDKSNCPHFSVFARDKTPLVGKKIFMRDILNRTVLVTDFRIIKSKHRTDGECLQLQIYVDNEVYVLFTGSAVLISEIRAFQDKIPFYTSITQADKYFSFA